MNFNDYGDKEIYRWTNKLTQYTRTHSAHRCAECVAILPFRLYVPPPKLVCLRVLEKIERTTDSPVACCPHPALSNRIRVCFIELFSAHTYGTIKIDLIHARHKSVANEPKPKSEPSQSNRIHFVSNTCQGQLAINASDGWPRPELIYTAILDITLESSLASIVRVRLFKFKTHSSFILMHSPTA